MYARRSSRHRYTPRRPPFKKTYQPAKKYYKKYKNQDSSFLTQFSAINSAANPRQTFSKYLWPPQKKLHRLFYASSWTMDSDLTTLIWKKSFCLNSCYEIEPDTNPLKHQPQDFTDIMSKYSEGYVVGTKVTIKLCPKGPDGGIPASFGWCFSQSPTPPAYADYLALQEDTKRQITFVGPSSESANNTLVVKWSAKKWYQKNVVGDNSYCFYLTGNAADLAYLHFYYFTTEGINPGSCMFSINMEFACVFQERVNKISYP